MASKRTAEACLKRVRKICLALPQTNERLSHGHPAFFIRDKKSFTYFHAQFHGDDRITIWTPAPDGMQEMLVDAAPDHYFRPPYVGVHGWIGVVLDSDIEWDEVEGVIEDAFIEVAPKGVLRDYIP